MIGTLCESFNYMINHIEANHRTRKRVISVLPRHSKSPMSGIGRDFVKKRGILVSMNCIVYLALPLQEFVVTYDAFLNRVHPDDREFVKNPLVTHSMVKPLRH